MFWSMLEALADTIARPVLQFHSSEGGSGVSDLPCGGRSPLVGNVYIASQPQRSNKGKSLLPFLPAQRSSSGLPGLPFRLVAYEMSVQSAQQVFSLASRHRVKGVLGGAGGRPVRGHSWAVAEATRARQARRRTGEEAIAAVCLV